MKCPLFGSLLLLGAGLLAPDAASAFGMTFGAPLEERMGGDYGPEHYERLQRKADAPRAGRCKIVRGETSSGPRSVRRCAKR